MHISMLDQITRDGRFDWLCGAPLPLATGIVSHLSLENGSELRSSTRVKVVSGIPHLKTASVP
jgi:hypothetical protein